MTRFTSLFFSAVALVCGCVLGCVPGGLKPEGFPDLVPCVITITQDGKPLEGANVQLVPDVGKNWITNGRTKADGKTSVFSYGKWKGTPIGSFKVVVTKIETEPSKFTEPAERSGPERDKYEENIANENLPAYQLVENVYTNKKTTPLTLEVKGATEATFDVGKAVRVRL